MLSETRTLPPSGASAACGATPRPACFHCGATCPDDAIEADGHPFCCTGCRSVYQILRAGGLERFYALDASAGVRVAAPPKPGAYAYLDDPAVASRLLDFTDGRISRVTFHVPAIHCLACVWLLENLFRLHPGVGPSRVNFPRKEVTLQFENAGTSLGAVVELLSSLGYEPDLNLGSGGSRPLPSAQRRLVTQIGIAGFAFGNTMMLSFASYLGLDPSSGAALAAYLGWISLALALPVLFFSAADYWRAAALTLRRGILTIEFPLALGIAALFAQSAWDVLTRAGEGYFDSFCGLVFLLLIGKWVQRRTFDAMSFDRDYRSYFPLSVLRREAAGDRPVSVSSLRPGDRVLVRHGELVPADARLASAEALVDYSFVTGESEPVPRYGGDLVYAGGRMAGGAAELEVVKETSQSYLTSLWNHEAFRKPRDKSLESFTTRAGRWFTAAVLALAAGAGLAWVPHGAGEAARVFAATLIVACPCALALAAPFTLGAALRALGRRRLYLKGTDVVEALAHVDTVVFDKTGTLTRAAAAAYEGAPLAADEARAVRAVATHSTHPLSRAIGTGGEAGLEAAEFREEPGGGVEGRAGRFRIHLGSRAWLRARDIAVPGAGPGASEAAVAVDGVFRGSFRPDAPYRADIGALAASLAPRYRLAILSGDSDRERARLRDWLGGSADLRFGLQPQDKLAAVRDLQDGGHRVLMAGDGLNDAGALRQSDVGIAVTEDIASFSPACDGILDAAALPLLPAFLRFSRGALRVIRASLVISLLYNAAGLSFAMRGLLSPLVSAVLMPLSSLTVVGFALAATSLAERRSGLGRS
jgi:Cu+-exporting ATPase